MPVSNRHTCPVILQFTQCRSSSGSHSSSQSAGEFLYRHGPGQSLPITGPQCRSLHTMPVFNWHSHQADYRPTVLVIPAYNAGLKPAISSSQLPALSGLVTPCTQCRSSSSFSNAARVWSVPAYNAGLQYTMPVILQFF